MISNPNTLWVAASLHLRSGECAQALALKVGGDATQHLCQVRPCAAAGVEDVDVVGRQAVGDAQVLLQRHVDACDHVANHLGGRVPDAKLLAKVGGEGLQERLVEVGHGLAGVEAVEEGRAVDPVQCRCRPVQQLDKAQGLKLRGRGQLLEEGSQDGRSQVPDGLVPVESLPWRA